MEPRSFDQSLDDLAASLGDPTRRGIFVMVRESAEPATAARVAEVFGIHPNVARHHLDRLVEAGYLRIGGPAAQRSGAGRPAKRYEATDKEILVSYPARRYDLLAELLVRVVERIAPDTGPEVAEAIGRDYGRALASEVGSPDRPGETAEALAAVARAMMGVGFEVATGDDRLLTSHCPFGSTAANHPEVVCRLDKGIMSGLLESIADTAGEVNVTPRTEPGEACVTEVDPVS